MSKHANPNTSNTNPYKNPIHQYGQGGSHVQHSKDDALTEMEFELLLEGAHELARSPYYYEHDPPMIVYTLGRLGLRRSELVHLEESWIDWREQMIRIPAHSPCDRGDDGGPCGMCRQSARQRVEHADDLSLEEALGYMWAPKSEAGAREVYFGHDVRAQLYLERYFANENYDQFGASGTAVGRRVTKAAEHAEGLDPDSIYPHCLRATAATNMIATRDLGIYQLMQIMGWEGLGTAQHYISRNSQKTARQLDGRGP